MTGPERYPLIWLPLAWLDYRWAADGPEWPNGGWLRTMHKEIEDVLSGKRSLDSLNAQESRVRATPVLRIAADIRARRVRGMGLRWRGAATGMVNPSIVYRVAPRRFLVLHGCERLACQRVQGIDPVPVRIAREWGVERVLAAHPQANMTYLGGDSA